MVINPSLKLRLGGMFLLACSLVCLLAAPAGSDPWRPAAGPAEGIYIYGLFLDGARWDKAGNKLADPEPKVLFAGLPVLHISATAEKKKSKDILYECPVYRAPKRTGLNFISFVDLRTEEAASKWTLRGACLLTTID